MNLSPDIPDNRQKLLLTWLNQQLPDAAYDLRPASSDASFRSYWRVTLPGGGTSILMDAPPEQENSAAFVELGGYLRAAGIHTPELYQWDLDLGFVLMEDLGTRSYATALQPETAHELYHDALQALSMMAALDYQALGPYDNARLHEEMELFPTWLVQRHLNVTWTPEELDTWRQTAQILCESALEQPTVFLHRDYHCRNLMHCPGDNPGVLDFQDALAGPVTYDPVSLLKDCYISWPRHQILEWLEAYRRSIRALLPDQLSEAVWLRWFDWMGVQRHLKAAGIFARLRHRDGKQNYLSDIPRTVEYIDDVCERYAELKPLGSLIRRLPIGRQVST